MGILGIDNRTENWKTAHTFAPFFEDANLRLKLVPGETCQSLSRNAPTFHRATSSMELFWKGMRGTSTTQRRRTDDDDNDFA